MSAFGPTPSGADVLYEWSLIRCYDRCRVVVVVVGCGGAFDKDQAEM